MAFTLTWLGNSGAAGAGRVVAAARSLTARGQRVLIVGDRLGPALATALGVAVGHEPVAVESNLWAVQPSLAALLEQGWQEVKAIEARYLRQPFFKTVFGEELPLLPGLDRALLLNALRQYDESGNYEVIIHWGSDDRATLLMWALPETLAWYVRRFTKTVEESDFAQALNPFIQPVAAAVLSDPLRGFSSKPWDGPLAELDGLLDRGRSLLADPHKLAAWLVAEPANVTAATYLWGCAQQAGLTVGGVLLAGSAEGSADSFAPLSVTELPPDTPDTALASLLPDFAALAAAAPRPLTVDVARSEVRLFLPGFAKAEIKLIQSGPEVTIEAGDQRRNLFLPPPLAGRAVAGAKFSDRYLTLSFG